MRGFLNTKPWSKSLTYTFRPQKFPPRNDPNWFFLKESCFRRFRRSANRINWIGKARGAAGTCFLVFSETFQNFSTTSQIWFFLKNFKRKDLFLSSSMYSLLSPASRDVFTGSLAQSVQELWLIIPSALRQNFGARSPPRVQKVLNLNKETCGPSSFVLGIEWVTAKQSFTCVVLFYCVVNTEPFYISIPVQTML